MALCKNRRCMVQLGESFWGEGYCSRRCLSQADGYDSDVDRPLLDPTDPTGQREICRNLDEIDAMTEAADIDPRLPKIIYLRKRGQTYRQIAAAMEPGISHQAVDKILAKLTRKHLRRCGIHKI